MTSDSRRQTRFGADSGEDGWRPAGRDVAVPRRSTLGADPELIALTSAHFTERFVTQLAVAIGAVPSLHAGGLTPESAHATLAVSVGVSRVSTRAVVAALTLMGLISESGDVLGRSRAGDRVRREIRAGGAETIAVAVVRSGVMADQIRSLRRVLTRRGDVYACGRIAAQGAAPQLVGLLARMPGVTVGSQLLIGAAAALELDSMWNETPPASRVDWHDIDKRRKAVGDRAEVYSMQLERSRRVGAIDLIKWVSRDDDGFGYDIEVLDEGASAVPARVIEVKGSAGADVAFHMSAHEYDVALDRGETYEVHFWGGINMRRDVIEEYEALRLHGYPIVVCNPGTELAVPPWQMRPDGYRVTRFR